MPKGKVCPKCNQYRNLETGYHNHWAHSDGKQTYCKVCINKKHRQVLSDLDPVSAFIHRKFSAWQTAAIASGKEWTLTKEFLIEMFHKQGGRCNRTNIELSLEKGNEYICSLDRIDCDKHYTPSNVQFLTAKENRCKNNGTPQEDFNRIVTMAPQFGFMLVPINQSKKVLAAK